MTRHCGLLAGRGRSRFGAGSALALAAIAFIAAAAPAQSTGSNDSQYSYGTATPESSRGPRVRVPDRSSNTLSNAARSSPANPDRSIYPGDPGSSKLDARLSRIGQTAADNKARILLRVPANAQIWIQGVKTKQTGEFRYFFSPPLTPGKQYSYRVRLRWTKHGKVVEENQRLVVSAGERIVRDFRPARSEPNPEAPTLAPSARPSIQGR